MVWTSSLEIEELQARWVPILMVVQASRISETHHPVGNQQLFLLIFLLVVLLNFRFFLSFKNKLIVVVVFFFFLFFSM